VCCHYFSPDNRNEDVFAGGSPDDFDKLELIEFTSKPKEFNEQTECQIDYYSARHSGAVPEFGIRGRKICIGLRHRLFCCNQPYSAKSSTPLWFKKEFL